ncbi:MAG: hypothetical protein WCR92_07145 [Candidatus Cloacimonadaceae bacterium]
MRTTRLKFQPGKGTDILYLVIALALAVGSVLMYGFSTRCKACRRWFALKKVEKKLLYSTKSETRTRHVFECRFCHRRQGYEKTG